MKMNKLVLLIVVMFTASGFAEDNGAQFKLTREDLIKTDNCVVVRMKIVAPPVEKAQMTRLVFSYRSDPNEIKELSQDVSSGIWPRENQKRQAEILLVAQVAKGNKIHPPMLMLSVQQQSPGYNPGAQSFQAHRLSKDIKLDSVFKIVVKNGSYPLGKQIRIGTLGVDPIYLSIESDR